MFDNIYDSTTTTIIIYDSIIKLKRPLLLQSATQPWAPFVARHMRGAAQEYQQALNDRLVAGYVAKRYALPPPSTLRIKHSSFFE